MKKFIDWLKYLDKNQPLSCVMAEVPDTIREIVLNWNYENIKLKHLDEFEGRETRPHVTIFYGLFTQNFKNIKSYFKKPIKIKLGNVTKFDHHQDFDVIKIDVISEDLVELHSKLKKLPNKESYPSYKPHLTLAYTKKNVLDNLMNNSFFNGIEFNSTDINFCDSYKNCVIHNIKSKDNSILKIPMECHEFNHSS